jgi:hypothetical protein
VIQLWGNLDHDMLFQLLCRGQSGSYTRSAAPSIGRKILLGVVMAFNTNEMQLSRLLRTCPYELAGFYMIDAPMSCSRSPLSTLT